MNDFNLKKNYLPDGGGIASVFASQTWVVILSTIFAVVSTIYYFNLGYIIAYGDAESHLNIAKRVIDSITPGFAQLGGIWLPLPHILLIPFVYFDYLWKTGLAGSIVSGIAFIISSVYLYKLVYLITKNKVAAFFGALVFILNPNILYMQSTPMTELPLIVFFILSSYYFILFLQDDKKILYLLFAGLFGFCASLSRYDGWALVLMEAGILFLYYFPYKIKFKNFFSKIFSNRLRSTIVEERHTSSGVSTFGKLEGRLIIFSTLAFFGVLIWLAWDWLILGDPLYFTHSQFSANSQQQGWLAKGQLPAYHNIFVAFKYYFFTSLQSGGTLLATTALVGIASFVFEKTRRNKLYIVLLLLVPFIFNVVTLFLGQSLIFLPGLTPITFEWTLFNVRYGTMMVPVFAFFIGYLFYRSKMVGRLIVVGIVFLQSMLFLIGFSPVLSLNDGVSGLSSFIAKVPDAQSWLENNYTDGLVLMDDYKRIISIIRTPIPMDSIIYIGNAPYWEESLVTPEKYAKWIIMQSDDIIWKTIYEPEEMNGRLYKYFKKVYTSEDFLIFERNDVK